MIQLPVLARRYLSERVVSPLYARNLLRLARKCRSLTVVACNSYLRRRLTEVSSVTVGHERAMLIVMWRYAYERELVDAMPRGIVKIKVARKPTRAWTLEQCCTAVKATFALDSVRLRTGGSLGRFLRCVLLLGYESGARRSDLWAMRRDDFDGNALWWSQAKTGEPVQKLLSPQCLRIVREMLAESPDGRVLGWVMCPTNGGKRVGEFLRSLGMPGSCKWLRRSGATHIEMQHPGKGRLHLGHKTIGLAEKHYIDWSQVRREIPQTPQLLE